MSAVQEQPSLLSQAAPVVWSLPMKRNRRSDRRLLSPLALTALVGSSVAILPWLMDAGVFGLMSFIAWSTAPSSFALSPTDAFTLSVLLVCVMLATAWRGVLWSRAVFGAIAIAIGVAVLGIAALTGQPRLAFSLQPSFVYLAGAALGVAAGSALLADEILQSRHGRLSRIRSGCAN